MQMSGDKSCQNRGQVVECRWHVSSVNISSICIASDIATAEYNQAELSKLEAQTTNSV